MSLTQDYPALPMKLRRVKSSTKYCLWRLRIFIRTMAKNLKYSLEIEMKRRWVKRQLEITDLAEDFMVTIQTILEERNLSNRKLAYMANIDDRTLGKIFNDGQIPNLLTVQKICLALDLKMTEILRKVGWEQPED